MNSEYSCGTKISKGKSLMALKSKKFQFVLIRHGESQWNQENRFTGWHDVDLSEKGRAEAPSSRRKSKKWALASMLCTISLLKEPFALCGSFKIKWIYYGIPVIKSWRLNERHYGSLTGLNKSETVEKYGEAQVKIWRRSYDTPPPAMPVEDARHPVMMRAIKVFPHRKSWRRIIKRHCSSISSSLKEELAPRIYRRTTADCSSWEFLAGPDSTLRKYDSWRNYGSECWQAFHWCTKWMKIWKYWKKNILEILRSSRAAMESVAKQGSKSIKPLFQIRVTVVPWSWEDSCFVLIQLGCALESLNIGAHNWHSKSSALFSLSSITSCLFLRIKNGSKQVRWNSDSCIFNLNEDGIFLPKWWTNHTSGSENLIALDTKLFKTWYETALFTKLSHHYWFENQRQSLNSYLKIFCDCRNRISSKTSCKCTGLISSCVFPESTDSNSRTWDKILQMDSMALFIFSETDWALSGNLAWRSRIKSRQIRVLINHGTILEPNSFFLLFVFWIIFLYFIDTFLK